VANIGSEVVPLFFHLFHYYHLEAFFDLLATVTEGLW